LWPTCWGGRPQQKYPWRTHLRGLLGQVVLGMATEITLNVIEKPLASEDAELEREGETGGELAA
jgi:hypothetical protein